MHLVLLLIVIIFLILFGDISVVIDSYFRLQSNLTTSTNDFVHCAFHF